MNKEPTSKSQKFADLTTNQKLFARLCFLAEHEDEAVRKVAARIFEDLDELDAQTKDDVETVRLMKKHKINVVFGDGSMTISSRGCNISFVIYGEDSHRGFPFHVKAYAEIL